VFAISGAGTVVTGTLTGGPLRIGDDVALLPDDVRARVRGLQTHKRTLELATPVSRVAVNVVGPARTEIARGDVMARPAEWRPTRVFEVVLEPVRGLGHDLSTRGAYKLYAGAAERDARVRVYGGGRLDAGNRGFARIRVAEPLVVAIGDRFVLRDAGRDATVAGGTVLDPSPPRRAGSDPDARLAARAASAPGELASLLVAERGAVSEADLRLDLGPRVDDVANAVLAGGWWIARSTLERARAAATAAAAAHHRDHPLDPGAPSASIHAAVASTLPAAVRSAASAIVDALIADGSLVREGAAIRLPGHLPTVDERSPELQRVSEAVAAGGAAPPTIAQLVSAGHPRGMIDAAIRTGTLVRIAPDLVVTPAFIDRAVAEIRSTGTNGMTVGALRERLGTSRKYAVPLVEYLDTRGLTARRGDVRVARGA
jgi:selenocysteine-specific elongation factor